MITKEDAMTEREFHHVSLKNADGTPLRCRANGVCKTWKTRPNDFRLPVKYGLRECFYITPRNAHEWSVGDGRGPQSLEAVTAEELGLSVDTPLDIINDLLEERGLPRL